MTNKGDLIRRSALREDMVRGCRRIGEAMGVVLPTLAFVNIIENAPTVEPEITEKQAILLLINNGWLVNHDKELREKWARPHGKWIPIKYRPLTSEERIAFAEHYGVKYCDTLEEKAFDCPMPEDGQSILISTSWGVVEDVVDNDIDGEGFICYGLEINGDWDGVDAWMPKPEPYKKEADNDN